MSVFDVYLHPLDSGQARVGIPLISALTFRVRDVWWLDCGHKITLPKCVDDVAVKGLHVQCLKCSDRISRHASNKRRPIRKEHS